MTSLKWVVVLLREVGGDTFLNLSLLQGRCYPGMPLEYHQTKMGLRVLVNLLSVGRWECRLWKVKNNNDKT